MTKAIALPEAKSQTSTLEDVLAASARKPRSLWSDAWRAYRRHRLAMFGTFVLASFILATLIGPILRPIDSASVGNFANAFQPPSLQHPFGTDPLGRDLLAMCLYGGRVSIAVGIAAMLVAITLGTVVGSVAGYFGGRVDNVLVWIADLFLAMPVLPVLLLVIYLFRDSLRQALGINLGIFVLTVVVIGALNWMPVSRLVRASFMSLKQKEFVEAARSIGAKTGSMMFKHILPNSMSPIIVAATLSVGAAILLESTLSFLGVGFPPDMPTWGRLLFDSRDYIELFPHLAIFPGLLISITVLSINFMGDGLRDALDPRRTQS
jgi:peptide/nickel transport system permease protein